MAKQPKLEIRQTYCKGHDISVSLIGDLASLTITDNRLFPDEDSRTERRNLGIIRRICCSLISKGRGFSNPLSYIYLCN